MIDWDVHCDLLYFMSILCVHVWNETSVQLVFSTRVFFEIAALKVDNQ